MSDAAQRYLNRLGAGVEDLFHHVLAVLHDPSCREANARALRMEWPLIPLPGWPDGDEDGSEQEKGGVVMPGQGRVVKRTHTTDEQSALGNATARIGETKFDICLNDRACWRNVPSNVWSYKLGGYQVLRNWLSYRERGVLGRPLTPEETQHFTDMAGGHKKPWAQGFGITDGTIDSAKRVDGRNDLWEIHVTPSGDAEGTLTLTGGRECPGSQAVCSTEDQPTAGSITVTVNSPEPEETPLTAWFSAFPTEHDGSADFTVRIAFSENIRDNISVCATAPSQIPG